MKNSSSLAVLFLLLTVSLQAVEPAALAKAGTPNIVYILADDLGYGDVQVLNPQRGKIVTPHLDKLAATGMTFTDAHSGSSVCTPTRYGVLTGRYAWRTKLQSGVLDNYVTPLIAAERLTVPAYLKQAGYHTACIGKWHLGYTIEGEGNPEGKAKGKNKDKIKGEAKGEKGAGAALGAITRDGPTTRGFDLFCGFHHARMIKSLFENDRVTQIVEPVEMLPLLTKRAETYIAERAKSGAPFFLYLPLNTPHTPIVPSQEWQGKSGLGPYADFVMQTDAAIGSVLAALDRAGIAQNTLVIVTSDNGCSGPAAKTDQLEKEGHFASAQYRGYKSDIWDGGHRVPFFVRWPAQVQAGSQCAQLICHTDLLATVAELLGKKLPDNAGEDSVSFLPALRGEEIPPVRQAVVHHSISGKFAIRQGNMKLELCAGSGGWTKGGGKESPQLYDMTADPGETTNLAAKQPETVAKLTKLLEEYVANGRSTPGAKQENDVEVKILKGEAAVAE